MERILLEFVATLDSLMKKVNGRVGDGAGLSKLTINQLRYIEAIAELDQPDITEIAEKLNITKASVTIGINKLAALGFVTKTRSNTDKRVFHVHLTAAGEQLVTAKYQALKEYGEFINAALSDDEARQLEAILAKLVKVFAKAK